jgi:hypothetical protein
VKYEKPSMSQLKRGHPREGCRNCAQPQSLHLHGVCPFNVTLEKLFETYDNKKQNNEGDNRAK